MEGRDVDILRVVLMGCPRADPRGRRSAMAQASSGEISWRMTPSTATAMPTSCPAHRRSLTCRATRSNQVGKERAVGLFEQRPAGARERAYRRIAVVLDEHSGRAAGGVTNPAGLPARSRRRQNRRQAPRPDLLPQCPRRRSPRPFSTYQPSPFTRARHDDPASHTGSHGRKDTARKSCCATRIDKEINRMPATPPPSMRHAHWRRHGLPA